MGNKKGLKPQTISLIGALLVMAVVVGISQIPSKSAEPVSLPMDWLEVITPQNLVDLGAVPQERQVFELEAGKVAQITVEPGQTISVAPQKGTLRVAHFTMSGELQVDGLLGPQKAQTFSLLAAAEQRLIYVMGEFMGPIEFEVGPISIELTP